MKNKSHIGLMLCGLVMMLIISSHAQSPTKVNIPFDFNVGDTALKAGTYTIKAKATDSLPEILGFQDGDGQLKTVVIGTRVDEFENNGRPHLLFNKIDGRYFLSQVWFDAIGSGISIQTGKLEKELAKNDAARTERLAVAMAK